MAKQKEKSEQTKAQKQNPAFDYLLLAAFAAFIVFFTTFKISGDDDVFWHLATGKHIMETGHIPSQDIFGFVTQGQEWMPFEWGWDVITYNIFKIGGYNAISIFRTIIFLLMFFIYYIILRKFKVSASLSILMFILIAFGIIDRLTPRPHIMSLLFFVLLLYLIISFRYFERKNIYLYFIPALFLLWANIHMGIIAGMFLLGIYVCSEIITFFQSRKLSSKEVPSLDKKQLITLIGIFAASLLVMLLNPNGFATYVYAYSHTKMKLLETINEWRSPFDTMFASGFVGNIYKVFLFSGALTLYYAIKKKDLFFALVYAGFVIYSVRAVRFTVDYIVIIAIFLTVAINFIIINLKGKGLSNFLNSSPVLKVILSILLILMTSAIPSDNLYLKTLEYYRVSGFGINSEFIPMQMIDFMKETKIGEAGEKPFNHFGMGGLLIWSFPNSKNFIDSRNLNDNIFFEYNSILEAQSGFEKKLNDYGIDYITFLDPDLVRRPGVMKKTIIPYLVSKSDEWKLVFWDDKSFLFVRNIPKFKEVIDKYEFKVINPYNIVFQPQAIESGFRNNLEQFKKELNRQRTLEPNGLFINSVLSKYQIKL
ncbi:MAG: hypothetical protein JSS63_04820 [Bacteroidetes bacterium]|nr:hypothetical protein [Bacteroidota bacterium]